MHALLILLLTLSFLLFGCESLEYQSLEYQLQGMRGGFSETRLREDVFSIAFSGDQYTTSTRTSNFSLLRCCEVTLSHGYRYFKILNSAVDKNESYNTTQIYYGNGISGSSTNVVNRPKSSNVIMCFKEKEEDEGMLFDAEFLGNSLCNKYGYTFNDGGVVVPDGISSTPNTEEEIHDYYRTLYRKKEFHRQRRDRHRHRR